MAARLIWRGLVMHGSAIPDGYVAPDHHVRLVLGERQQYAFLEHVFAPAEHREGEWRMWLETAEASYRAGSDEFFRRVGSLIRHRGLLANLSIRENLLLPFLYWNDEDRLAMAAAEVEEVAEWLGLRDVLDQRAGERSSYTHALVSLGRCMLARPEVIIAQEVHVGMPPDRLARFAKLALEAVDALGAGVLYLTGSPHEGSGIGFAETLTVKPRDEKLASEEAG